MSKSCLPDGFTVAEPMIPCADYWPDILPDVKLAAYRRMLEEGQLSHLHCQYNRRLHSCLITYRANQPHEWILEILFQYTSQFLMEQTGKEEIGCAGLPP